MLRLVLVALTAACTLLAAVPPAAAVHVSPLLVERVDFVQWGGTPVRQHRPRPHYAYPPPRRPARTHAATGTVLDQLSRDRRFTKLVELISDAGLRGDFTGSDEDRTIFAPTNEALAALAPAVDKLRGDRDALAAILRYHMITGARVSRADLADGQLLDTDLELDSLNGQKQVIRVSKLGIGGGDKDAGRVVLNMYAAIDEADIPASNGVIHALSAVLLPPEKAFTALTLFPAEFSIQAMALMLTGLSDRVDSTNGVTAWVAPDATWKALGHITLMELFHPQNRDVLKKTLLNHYADGIVYTRSIEEGNKNEPMAIETWAGTEISIDVKEMRRGLGDETKVMRVDGMPAILEDIPAANGVVHVINMVFIHKAQD